MPSVLAMIQFLLATYGLTLIVTQSKIFRPVRGLFEGTSNRLLKFFGDMLHCPMCFGFWSGIFWSRFWPAVAISDLPRWETGTLNILAAGCVSSAFCWIVRVALHRLGEDDL